MGAAHLCHDFWIQVPLRGSPTYLQSRPCPPTLALPHFGIDGGWLCLLATPARSANRKTSAESLVAWDTHTVDSFANPASHHATAPRVYTSHQTLSEVRSAGT